jgi:hypothetical protein
MHFLPARIRSGFRVFAAVALSVYLPACSGGAAPLQTGLGDDAGGGPSGADDAGAASTSAPTDAAVTRPSDSLGPREGGASSLSSSTDAHAASCRPALPPVTSSTQYLCDPGGSGKCNDCGDCRMVIDGTASMQVVSCGTSCIGQPNSCVTACLSGKSPTLSSPCQTCLVALFDCTTSYCAGPCVTGTKAQCNQCLAANPSPGPSSCNSVFLACAGLENNPGYSGQ